MQNLKDDIHLKMLGKDCNVTTYFFKPSNNKKETINLSYIHHYNYVGNIFSGYM